MGLGVSMSDLRNAAQMALEALENCRIEYDYHGNPMDEENANLLKAITALRAALAQPEQEPVTWMSPNSQPMLGKDDGTGSAYHIITTSKATGNHTIPLYTAPPQRKPLTDEALMALLPGAVRLPPGWKDFARAIEREHGIGGES